MRIACSFVLFFPLLVLIRAAIAQPPELDHSIATRQNVFSIPFTVDPPRPGEKPPVEVQLFVSGNRGVTWDLYQRQPVTAKRFHFRAGSDGEYWFAVRTSGPNDGNVTALDRPNVELRVIVDTVQPRLDLVAAVGSSGEVLARWAMSDRNLDPASLELEYQTDTEPQWQSIALRARSAAGGGQPTVMGSTTWWPRAAERVVNIRATVRDQAGNSTTATRRLQVPSEPEPSESHGPSASLADSVPSYPRVAPSDPKIASSARTALDGSIPWAPEPTREDPTMQANDRSPAGGRLEAERSESHAPRSNADSPSPGIGAQGDHHGQADAARTAPPTFPDNPFRQVGARRDSLASEDDSHVGRPNRAGEPRRTTTSRRFQLDYEIEKGPPGQLGRVELWYTTNHGRTWLHYGNDEDKQSPFLVEVDREGLYGFRLILHGADGLSARPPRSGDAADIWVHVDWTPPVVRLTSARYGSGSQFGELDIRWEASDDYLVQRPITLSYGPTSDGPWTTIAAELLNTGQHTWRVDERVPDEFYLRIEVRDLAGNVSSDQVTEPISSHGLLPRGRIRDIRPAGDADRESESSAPQRSTPE